MADGNPVPSSFRDPSGFVFWHDGLIFRQINTIYKDEYNCLMESGLYEELIRLGLLISHKETSIKSARVDASYKVIQPEPIEFISYPYEWCFSQLKDAALTTLQIQKKSLNFGMSLKDCSAYNVQFKNGKPIFIDTLSFERYYEGRPWIAYRQFCQHFLAPLALMSYKDVRLNQLFRIHLDGIPLDLASSLLPIHSRFNLSILSHIHLHASNQKRYASKQVKTANLKLSRLSLMGLIDSLESTINGLKWRPCGTEWAEYYKDINYTKEGFEHKKQVLVDFFNQTKPKTVWDLGANDGIFSRISGNKGIRTISFDNDPAAVEKNYLECRTNSETHILPLIVDLTNPSSGIGWQNKERMSLLNRGPADCVLALALVHHLAISNNVPLNKVAEFFSDICCDSLIIEFVPKDDSQVQRLLMTRKDIFPNYIQQVFENEFNCYFKILRSEKIKDSKRVLYLMRKTST